MAHIPVQEADEKRTWGHESFSFAPQVVQLLRWGQHVSPPTDRTEARSTLEVVKSDIIRYTAYLNRQHYKQEYLQEYLQRIETTFEDQRFYSQVYYPVLTLPKEITIRIFVNCLPAHGRIVLKPGLRSRSPPFNLIQVCRQWREIGQDIWELWTSADIAHTDFYSPIQSARVSHFLQTLFSRAKGKPLSLTIRSLKAPLSVLTAYSNQFRRLELKSVKDVDQIYNMPFSCLEHLAIEFSTPPEAGIRSLLMRAPSLRELRLLNYSLAFNFVLPSLTKLELVRLSVQDILALATNHPQLTELTCLLTGPILGDPIPAVFHHLRSLTTSSAVLPYVNAPNLGSLVQKDPDLELGTTDDFLLRHPTIKRLGLSFKGIEFDDDYSLEEHLLPCSGPGASEVVSLEVDTGLLSDQLLHFIIEYPHFMPELRNLKIFTDSVRTDFELLARVKRMRQYTLQSCHVIVSKSADQSYSCWGTDPPPIVGKELKRLIADGFDFVVIDLGAGAAWPDRNHHSLISKYDRGQHFPSN
ncbi:hypothetical protein B0H11DRAFT_1950062 [Mycena galericulata]|nr:hypothetical protein B0H11DRAFT_1950062 [Mycena galericulata]